MKRLLLAVLAVCLAAPSLAEEGQVVVVTSRCERTPFRYTIGAMPTPAEIHCTVTIKNMAATYKKAAIYVNSMLLTAPIGPLSPNETLTIQENIIDSAPQPGTRITIETFPYESVKTNTPKHSPYESRESLFPPTTHNSE